MVNSSSNWQDALNNRLVNRLTRPLYQPGMMKMGMSQGIVNRCDRFLNRLSLLSQQMQRWGNNNTLSSESVPIVYAQPVSLPQTANNSQPTFPPNQSNITLPIIQRKSDSAQTLPILSNQNTSNLPNEQILETPINSFANSSLSIPVIKPKSNPENLPNIGEIPPKLNPTNAPAQNIQELTTTNQTPIIQSKSSADFPPNQPTISVIQRKLNSAQTLPTTTINNPLPTQNTTDLSSNQNLETPINDSANSTLSIPVLQPKSSPENLANTREIPLLANLSTSNESTSNLQEITTISIPVVQPKSSPKNLPNIAEKPLTQKSSNITDSLLPVIQAKQQDVTLSLPVVHPVNSQKSTPIDNYSENPVSIKLGKLASPVSNLPIVTAQPLNSETNLTKISPNEQNQTTSNFTTSTNINSHSPINQNNSNENISPLPLVTVKSTINPPLSPHFSPLPLAKNSSISNSINQQGKLSNQNPIILTKDASPPPKTLNHALSSPIETAVSPMKNQTSIDIDKIANQVESKLMRRLVIESERRGKMR
ncbi:MAG TPA: hypothetical protein VK184_00855 [Nostocaceae cyanobacterium]|nr:hypothetical protein [Nostocaceae cyanobacterium]